MPNGGDIEVSGSLERRMLNPTGKTAAALSERQKAIKIVYTNYRGETALREVLPQRVWFGSTDWHPEEQWLLDAIDLDKGAPRSFALRDIQSYAG
jgi:predicted DNA-binding transcriptional regulator YafY